MCCHCFKVQYKITSVSCWRTLLNEELRNLYASPNIIRVIKSRRKRWDGRVARMGGMTNVYNILVGEPEGKRPLGTLGRKWEDNIKMDLRKVGWEIVDWMHLAQDSEQWRAVVNTVMNLLFP
jgi:hypothetical protein